MTSPRVSATCRPQPWWQESHRELCSGSQAPLAMNKCFCSLTGTQSFPLACCVCSEDVPFSVLIVAVRHFPLSLCFSKSHSWPLACLLSVCRPSGLTGGSAPGPPFLARSPPRARGATGFPLAAVSAAQAPTHLLAPHLILSAFCPWGLVTPRSQPNAYAPSAICVHTAPASEFSLVNP